MQLNRPGAAAAAAGWATAFVLGTFGAATPGYADGADAAWTLGQDNLLYTDTDNVRVLTSQVGVARKLDTDGGQVSMRGLVDVVSAASVDVVSHATMRFEELRTEGNLAVSYALGEVLPSLSYRISREPDYDSQSIGGGAQVRLGGADTVLGAHYTGTFDVVGRSHTPASQFAEPLTTHSADVGLTQNLGAHALVRGVYTLTVQRGYMEKPYRFVPLFAPRDLERADADGVRVNLDTFERYSLSARPPEEVPNLRIRHALGARMMLYIKPLDASLRIDDLAYIDDWGVFANTTEVALDQPVFEHLTLDTFARAYFQTGASFWERTYRSSGDSVPGYRTLDRKLSPYWALTLGTRAELDYDDWSFYLEFNATETHFMDFLLLTDRFALVSQLGLEWRP